MIQKTLQQYIEQFQAGAKQFYKGAKRHRVQYIESMKDIIQKEFTKQMKDNKQSMQKIEEIIKHLQQQDKNEIQENKKKVQAQAFKLIPQVQQSNIFQQISRFQARWKNLKTVLQTNQDVLIFQQQEKSQITFFFAMLKSIMVTNLTKGNQTRSILDNFQSKKIIPNIQRNAKCFKCLYETFFLVQAGEIYLDISLFQKYYGSKNSKFVQQLKSYLQNIKSRKNFRIIFQKQEQEQFLYLSKVSQVCMNCFYNYKKSQHVRLVSPHVLLRLIEILLNKLILLTRKNAKYNFYFETNKVLKYQNIIYLQFYIGIIAIGVSFIQQYLNSVINSLVQILSTFFKKRQDYNMFMKEFQQKPPSDLKSAAGLLYQYQFCFSLNQYFQVLHYYWFKNYSNKDFQPKKPNYAEIMTKQTITRHHKVHKIIQSQKAKHLAHVQVVTGLIQQLHKQKGQNSWKKIKNKYDLYKVSYFVKKLDHIFSNLPQATTTQTLLAFNTQLPQINFQTSQFQRAIYFRTFSDIQSKFPQANSILKQKEDVKYLKQQQVDRFFQKYIQDQGITNEELIDKTDDIFSENIFYINDLKINPGPVNQNILYDILNKKWSPTTRNVFQRYKLQNDLLKLVQKNNGKFQIWFILEKAAKLISKLPTIIGTNQNFLSAYAQDVVEILNTLRTGYKMRTQFGQSVDKKNMSPVQKQFFQICIQNLDNQRKYYGFQSPGLINQPLSKTLTQKYYSQNYLKQLKKQNSTLLQQMIQRGNQIANQLQNKAYQSQKQRNTRLKQLNQIKAQSARYTHILSALRQQISIQQKKNFQKFYQQKKSEQLNNIRQILQIVVDLHQGRRLNVNQSENLSRLSFLLTRILDKNPDDRIENVLYDFIRQLSTRQISESIPQHLQNKKKNDTTFDLNSYDFVENLVTIIYNLLKNNSYYQKLHQQVAKNKQVVEEMKMQLYQLNSGQIGPQQEKFRQIIEDQIIYLQKRIQLATKIQNKVKQDIKNFFVSINISGSLNNKTIGVLQKIAFNRSKQFVQVLDILMKTKSHVQRPSNKTQIVQAYKELQRKLNERQEQMMNSVKKVQSKAKIFKRNLDVNLQNIMLIKDQKLRKQIQNQFRNSFIRIKQQQFLIRKSEQKLTKLSKQMECVLRGMMAKKFNIQYIGGMVAKTQKAFLEIGKKNHGKNVQVMTKCSLAIFNSIARMLQLSIIQGKQSFNQCSGLIGKKNIQNIIKQNLIKNLKQAKLIELFWKQFDSQ